MPLRKLRPHQAEAVDAAALLLGGPSTGARTSVVAACGTGKTTVGERVAYRVAPRGRRLLLFPTLDLLVQTALTWHEAGWHNRRQKPLAVCSLSGDEGLLSAGVARATTNATQLALWCSALDQDLTVFATYPSLDVIVDAHTGPHGVTPLAPWDLIVVDEAHRTSGYIGKPWAAVHDDRFVPARRRLYLT
ncbi:MAG: DEAD/DEAH box helicase family protein, partial [Streptomycetaceae bacterium]|nr:DEAD/DEAH box helicase family protein [Streptomycetaceae bacterium]